MTQRTFGENAVVLAVQPGEFACVLKDKEKRAMPTTTRYTVIDGEILSENRAGVKRDYVPDPLGSTLALLDNTQTQTDTFSYYPYGEVASRTGTTATPFQYIGTLGYYQDNSGRTYVRARHLRTAHGRWITEDPIGFDGEDADLYIYSFNCPLSFVDIDGGQAQRKRGPRKNQVPSGSKSCMDIASCVKKNNPPNKERMKCIKAIGECRKTAPPISDEFLICQYWQESTFNPNAQNGAPRGIGQVKPGANDAVNECLGNCTFEQVANPKNWCKYNIPIAIMYMYCKGLGGYGTGRGNKLTSCAQCLKQKKALGEQGCLECLFKLKLP